MTCHPGEAEVMAELVRAADTACWLLLLSQRQCWHPVGGGHGGGGAVLRGRRLLDLALGLKYSQPDW